MSTYPCLDISKSCWTATCTYLLTSPRMHHTRYHPEPTARNHRSRSQRITTTRQTWHQTHPTNRRRHSILCPGGGHHRPRRPINTGIRTNDSHYNDERQGRATARLSCLTSECDDSISCIENAAKHAFRRILPLRKRRKKQGSRVFFPRWCADER